MKTLLENHTFQIICVIILCINCFIAGKEYEYYDGLGRTFRERVKTIIYELFLILFALPVFIVISLATFLYDIVCKQWIDGYFLISIFWGLRYTKKYDNLPKYQLMKTNVLLSKRVISKKASWFDIKAVELINKRNNYTFDPNQVEGDI